MQADLPAGGTADLVARRGSEQGKADGFAPAFCENSEYPERKRRHDRRRFKRKKRKLSVVAKTSGEKLCVFAVAPREGRVD